MSIVVARTTANVTHGGQRQHIIAGQPWDADDSLVKAYPDLFTDDTRAVNRTGPVEQATKAPGEKRTTRRA